ncbi:MAG TPA: hypothetical protein VH327_03950 [Gammaproteobacteria bacterium]|jgi:hypothetical protein|nr:hypothetical protein [Gammaproteobacteria bacterium]
MDVRIRAALAALSLVLLSSCGGGSSSDNSDFEGIWRGTYTPDGSSRVPLVAVARHGSTAFFYDSNGLTFVIPNFAGPGDVAQGGQLFPAFGFIFDNGSHSLPIDLKASVSASQITGTLTVNAAVLRFALTGDRPFSGDPSIVPGRWTGSVRGPDTAGTDLTFGRAPITVTVAPDGTFSGTELSGCNISGTITPSLSGDNLFDVSLTQSSFRGFEHCGGAMAGLGYESDTDDADFFEHAPGIYYYIVVSNNNVALDLELHAK